MSILGRRPILTGGLGLVGLGALGWGGSVAVCSAGGGDLAALIRPLFVALADIRDADRVGQAWLAETGPDRLLRDILARPDFAGAALVPDDALRRQRLAAAIRAEFAAGDTVLADRWVVARAEAQIAAARAAGIT
ncbi:MAG: hypothetical protein KJN93_01135 [Alphaproteobacteria bacterium]|nr:hypothetical protein [Alphaproteobacteria bacterium]